MTTYDVRTVVQQSFLGVLPDAVQREVVDSGRIVELPAGKLIYDPQLSVVLNGMLRAIVDDGSGRHVTVSYLKSPMAAGIGVAAGLEFPVAFQAVSGSVQHAIADELDQRGLALASEAGPLWAAGRRQRVGPRAPVVETGPTGQPLSTVL